MRKQHHISTNGRLSALTARVAKIENDVVSIAKSLSYLSETLTPLLKEIKAALDEGDDPDVHWWKKEGDESTSVTPDTSQLTDEPSPDRNEMLDRIIDFGLRATRIRQHLEALIEDAEKNKPSDNSQS